MKAVSIVINLAYIITLVAAGMATSGFLAAACFTLAGINALAFVLMVVTWGVLDASKKTKNTVSLVDRFNPNVL